MTDLTAYTAPLTRGPAVLRSAIVGWPEGWLDCRHADDVFSPREAVAHLVLCERDWSWVDRIQAILDPGYRLEIEEVTEQELLGTRSIPDLLDDFDRLRVKCLADLVRLGLTDDDLERRDEDGATIAQLLATWVAHDLYHLGQIFKSYSAPFVDRVGPYQEYLNLPHFH